MIEIRYGRPGGGVRFLEWRLGASLPSAGDREEALGSVGRIDVSLEPSKKAVREILDRLGKPDRSVTVPDGALRWHGGNARELLGLLWSEPGLAAMPKVATYGSMTRDAIDALEAGRGEVVRHMLTGTDQRDELTAVAEHAVSRAHGKVVKTTFRLNGAKVSPRTVELLLAVYG